PPSIFTVHTPPSPHLSTLSLHDALPISCSRLSPGTDGQIALRYVNPSAKWTQYTKIMIQPVTFWGDENSKVSTEDQQRLVNFFYTTLNEELSKQFQVVDQDGADV